MVDPSRRAGSGATTMGGSSLGALVDPSGKAGSGLAAMTRGHYQLIIASTATTRPMASLPAHHRKKMKYIYIQAFLPLSIISAAHQAYGTAARDSIIIAAEVTDDQDQAGEGGNLIKRARTPAAPAGARKTVSTLCGLAQVGWKTPGHKRHRNEEKER